MYLLLLRGPGADTERVDVEGELAIGRAPGGLVLADDDVSRRHASVRALPDGALEIEDLSSRNGTRVNGEVIRTPRRLQVGDRVEIGIAVLEASADVLPETRLAGGGRGLPETTVRPAARPAGGGTQPAIRAEGTGPAHGAQTGQPPPQSPQAAIPAAPFGMHSPARRRQAIASRRLAPAALTFAAIVATAVALVIYFAMH